MNKFQQLAQSIRIFFVAAVFFFLNVAFAGQPPKLPAEEAKCLAISITDSSHEVAIRRLMSISEVRKWEALVKTNKRHVSAISSSNNTLFHDGQCLWEINLYEEADGQFLRWNTYQISLNKPLAYRLDIVNPEQKILVKFPPSDKAGAANE